MLLKTRSIFVLVRRTMSDSVKIFESKTIKNIFPKLDNSKHKGQCGRIGVIGGSREYTGAPYFAGMAALRFGSDLVHIFCTENAGISIKCYSPELIVHPILNDLNAIEQIDEWFQRLHAFLIGPGLGRDPKLIEMFNKIISKLAASEKPLVVDADGLYIITLKPSLLKGAKNVTLTPNKIEFERLCNAVAKETGVPTVNDISLIDYFGPGVTIVEKGEVDKVFNSIGRTKISGGSVCRCGGQGDILSGSIALFTYWAHESKQENPSLFGAYAGCYVTKKLSEEVFSQLGRSMVAGDFIPAIPKLLNELEK